MAADALAPCIASSIKVEVLHMPDKQVLVFSEDGFQTNVPFQYGKVIENANIFLCFLK